MSAHLEPQIDHQRQSLSATGSKSRTIWVVIAGLVVLGSAAVHLAFDASTQAAPWMNNDTAFLMFVATEMNAGERLYVDWQDPDPPSIFFVLLAAIRVAGSWIHPGLAFDLIVLLTASAGLAMLVASVRRMGGDRGVALLTAAAYLLFVLKPGPITRDFGQREHLFALLFIPELFVLASRRPGACRPLWCAALGFLAMMKPQFLAALGVAELLALRWRAPRWDEFLGFGIGAVAPFALLWLHAAESLTALFTVTLALHRSGAYALLNRPVTDLLQRGPLTVCGIAAAATVLMLVVSRRGDKWRILPIVGTAAIFMTLVGVVHQQKYFPYHFTPLFGVAAVCGAWAFGEMASPRFPRLLPFVAVAVMTIGLWTFHADVAQNGDPTAVRLGKAVEGPNNILVISAYSHGLCTPFVAAPRCVGPNSFDPSLPGLASGREYLSTLSPVVESLRARIARRRPDLLAISEAALSTAPGKTPALLFTEEMPVFTQGEYVPLSPATRAAVRARGWLLLRRRDVREVAQ